MASVRALCKHGVVLENGMISFIGEASDAIDMYAMKSRLCDNISILSQLEQNEEVQIEEISINNSSFSYSYIRIGQKTLTVHIKGIAHNVRNCEMALILRNRDGAALAFYSFHKNGLVDLNGPFEYDRMVELPSNIHSGFLKVDLFVHQPEVRYVFRSPDCCILEVEGVVPNSGQILLIEHGLLTLQDTVVDD